MAPAEEAEPSSAVTVDAAAFLKAGAKAHQLGDLAAAEGSYSEALTALGVEAPGPGEPLRPDSADLPASETLAEALHLLGALRVQRAAAAARPRGDDSDSEDEGEGLSPALADITAAVTLLRAALAALPPSVPAASRARPFSSLGLALLRLGGGFKDAPRPAAEAAALAEAAEHLREAARLDGGRWMAWMNLARALRLLQDDAEQQRQREAAERYGEERRAALQAALRLRPDHPSVLYRLGMLCKEQSRTEEGVTAFQRYLELAEEAEASVVAGRKPGPAQWRTATVRHWLAVLKGDSTSTAPAEYVAGLFDSYAEKFDEHLVQKLGYRTPELLAAEIRAGARDSEAPSFHRCGDLGCGTGLMAPLLRELGVERLEGVDLSAGMLAKAQAKGGPGVGYDRLVQGDLLELFEAEGAGEPFDLLVAADVLVYVGDLAPVLAASARSLARPHGLMVVSTEAPARKGGANEGSAAVPAGGYALAESGRYMHTAAYVRNTAEAYGLVLAARRNVVLRYNSGKPVHGHIHVLRPAPQA